MMAVPRESHPYLGTVSLVYFFDKTPIHEELALIQSWNPNIIFATRLIASSWPLTATKGP